MIYPIDKFPNSVILSNGEFPQNPHALALLKNAETLICCDGAINNLLHIGIEPDYIIGDCDSISQDNLNRFKNIIIEDKDIECNDLQKSLRLALSLHKTEVLILGASGLREDHALANLSIIIDYSQYISITMMTNYGIFIPINQTTSFCTFEGEQISIFSFNKDNIFTFHGLRYPVNNRQFLHLWEGSLNEALGDKITIECSGSRAVVYFAFSH